MSANEQQVGGTHYKSGYIHWDWVVDCGLGYLDGNASKYVARWKKKNGAEDLLKARHYIVKLIERITDIPPRARLLRSINRQRTYRFCMENGLGPVEDSILQLLANWQKPADLELALKILDDYLRIIGEPPKPVPLTEENKHAQRQGEGDQEYLQFPIKLIGPIEDEDKGEGSPSQGNA